MITTSRAAIKATAPSWMKPMNAKRGQVDRYLFNVSQFTEFFLNHRKCRSERFYKKEN
jgi:hypothetical protein